MRGGPMPRMEQDHRSRNSYPEAALIKCGYWRQRMGNTQQEGQEMVVSRHCLLRREATEYQWLGLSSSRWKSFLRHMELPHPGPSNRGGGADCVEFAESRAASAIRGGT